MPGIPQPFDREPVPRVTLADLDQALVAHTLERGHDLGRYRGADDIASYLLRSAGVVQDGEELRPTVAGVLAFAPEPDRWLPASGIDIAIFRSEQTLPTRARVQQIRSPIFSLIDEAVEVLRNECTVSQLDGARLVNTLDVPLIVLRELTTNAAVHRDLSLFGSQIRIQVFPQHIEWISPGGLPAGITIATLLTAQFARNPSLAQFLFHAGYIEKFGMGLDAVIDALEQAGLGAPEFHDDGHSFRVCVRRADLRSPAAPDIATPEGREAAILALFDLQTQWRQQDIMERLGIPRTTLQRTLDELLDRGRIVARGATRNRVYLRGQDER
jgi:predicted HTH transcriptional regulator